VNSSQAVQAQPREECVPSQSRHAIKTPHRCVNTLPKRNGSLWSGGRSMGMTANPNPNPNHNPNPNPNPNPRRGEKHGDDG